MENPVYVEAFVIWENELRQPEKQRNPDFFRNVLADGVNTLKLGYAFGRITDTVELHSEETRCQIEQEADGLIKWNAHNRNLAR